MRLFAFVAKRPDAPVIRDPFVKKSLFAAFTECVLFHAISFQLKKRYTSIIVTLFQLVSIDGL